MSDCQKWIRAIQKQCGLPLHEVPSMSGVLLGWVCKNGHITPTKRQVQIRPCWGCGSRTKDRHGIGCAVVEDKVSTALLCAEIIVTSRTSDIDSCEQAWAEVQETIERVLPFADSRLGGPL